jgi:haloacetate dehalogenase
LFDSFRLDYADVGELRLRVRYGGEGPAVLLVHGHPRTHTTWYAVAPALVHAGYRVVCPDLRGYGDSTVPPDCPDHSQASKRARRWPAVMPGSRLPGGIGSLWINPRRWPSG